MAELIDGPATRYACSLSRWERNDWWRVEARAWERHQSVRFALAFFSPADVWKDLNRQPEGEARGGGCLGVVGHIAALCLPVLAMLGIFGWVLRPDRTAPILMVGLMCLVAALLFTRGLISDIRNPEKAEVKSAHIVSYLHLVPSSITLVIALSAWAADKVDAPLLILAIAGDAAIGIVPLVAFRRPGNENEARWLRNLTRLKTALEAVPEDQRARIADDIRTAIAELERAGLVSAEDAAHAQGRSLGLLGIGMAPRPDMTRTLDSV